MGINLRLKELRDEFCYTQNYVADYLGIKQNTYSQYENGKREPSIYVLVMLSKLYQTSVDYILGLID